MAGRSNPITPLRYPGGKSAFAPFVKAVIETNDLVGGHYLEPFAGGCGVALDLLFNNYCQQIHINDLDSAIYNFWFSIIHSTDDFLKKLIDAPINVDEWYRQKNILINPDDHTKLEHGFAAFYLNRTNHSGILKAGMIGGKEQAGDYKIDARFNKNRLEKLITRIAREASRIHVYNLDAHDLLRQVERILPINSLIYLDPPYYVKGQGLYRNYYVHNNHVQIRDELASLQRKWIVSYDSCNEIKEIYKDYRQDEYVLAYCAHKKQKGSEVMIYSDEVIIPCFQFEKAS